MPPDERVAFLPEQCQMIQNRHPELCFIVEPSESRCVPDSHYLAHDIPVSEDMDTCDVLFGIKEVPPHALIENKTYFIFSHTIKKQVHNRALLQEVLKKNITLIDYECLTDARGERTVAFGRFAGIVGAYNAFRMWMQRFHKTPLKAASECGDLEEMLDYARHHLAGIGPVRILVTGSGRVGKGAVEVLRSLGVQEITPEEFRSGSYGHMVFTVLSSRHYYSNREGRPWDEEEFRRFPFRFRSCFSEYAACTDIFISCHYWNPEAPPVFTPAEAGSPGFAIRVVSDVTCDLNGSVPTTIRASTIQDPFYDLNPETWKEEPAFSGTRNISVCAVDNLPCELPLDASRAFGHMLMEHVVPELASGGGPATERAVIARDGRLGPRFSYLEDYVRVGFPSP